MTEPLLEKLRAVTVEAVWAALQDRGYENCFIGNLTVVHPDLTMVGRARTLRYVPYRPDLEEELLRQSPHALNKIAVEDSQPGDVLVVDAFGRIDAAFAGDIILGRFFHKHGAGVVVEGAVRDLTFLRSINLPLYTRAAHAAASTGRLLGLEQQVPVHVAGVCVRPGDFLLGDSEGVVVIPAGLAEEVIAEAAALDEKEVFLRSKIEQGATLRETYPPNAEIQAEYEKTRKS